MTINQSERNMMGSPDLEPTDPLGFVEDYQAKQAETVLNSAREYVSQRGYAMSPEKFSDLRRQANQSGYDYEFIEAHDWEEIAEEVSKNTGMWVFSKDIYYVTKTESSGSRVYVYPIGDDAKTMVQDSFK